MQKWRKLVKYPELAKVANSQGAQIMDALDELIPIEDKGDRMTTFLSWINSGMDAGILTYSDKMAIQRELIDGCGGM